MEINPSIIEILEKDAGNARTQKAKNIYQTKKVTIKDVKYENNNNFSVRATVEGTEVYETYVEILMGEIEDVICTCEDYYRHYGVCKHTLASVLEMRDWEENKEHDFLSMKKPELKITKKTPHRAFKQIITTFYNEEIESIEDTPIFLEQKDMIKLEPKIIYDKFANSVKVEFKIGNKRMYKIKDLSQFYTNMLQKEMYRYGDKLQFIHTEEVFVEESRELLAFILKYAELIKYANSNSNSNFRYYGKALSESSILLGNTGIDELFEILKGKQVNFQKDYQNQKIMFMESQPEIKFSLKKREEKEYYIIANKDIFTIFIWKGKQYQYILDENKLYRCSKEFENTTLKLLKLFKQNYITELTLGEEELISFFSIMMPKLKDKIQIEEIKELEKYQPKKLGVKVFLDFDNTDNLIAEVKFCYGEKEFNPLNQNEKLNFPINKIEETKVLNIFRKTGFMLDVQYFRFILPEEEKIYKFLTEDINFYMQKFEVLVTDNFKTKQIKQPKINTLGIKVENDLLSIDLKGLDIDADQLQEIMEKYHLKKKYHRLKDGSFLNLEENQEIEFLDKLVTGMKLSYNEIADEKVYVPTYRTMYLNQLLKKTKNIQVQKNESYKKIVNELDKEKIEEEAKLPAKLESILRYYQKIGFRWLKTLDEYRFGGILADDMGLRKNYTSIVYFIK